MGKIITILVSILLALGIYGGGNTLLGGNSNINPMPVKTFLGLTDTPSTYTGSANKSVIVNASGTALTFGTSTGGTWGSITGTLSDQTDLQTELDTKLSTSTFGLSIDGQGGVITTGIKSDWVAPFSGTITGWNLLANTVGTTSIELWKDTYANFPPTVADGIATTTLSGASKNQATGLSISFTSGDIIRFNVSSATAITKAILSLIIIRN